MVELHSGTLKREYTVVKGGGGVEQGAGRQTVTATTLLQQGVEYG